MEQSGEGCQGNGMYMYFLCLIMVTANYAMGHIVYFLPDAKYPLSIADIQM